MVNLSEDKVRQDAQRILGFVDSDKAVSDVGQITTFNMLGFNGVNDKPDGWYLPKNKTEPAIILETKASKVDLGKKEIAELLKNCKIAKTQYSKVVGILYNGIEVKAFIDEKEVDISSDLQNKSYYLKLFEENKIDKQKIYNLTSKINNCLHFKFSIMNLYHRMVFTACALVAKRYGASLNPGMRYSVFKTEIIETLKEQLSDSINQNQKLNILIDVYSGIEMNATEGPELQEAIDNFIGWVCEISDSVNSDYWNGEDVMGIFFNEFNRYKKKSENGQIFTPDHITSLMYRLLEVNQNDIVLDAACGSGAFLVKSMCNMIKEAGGINTDKAKEIKNNQLYGIEYDRDIYALACANMLIHKDGKTNLEKMDTRNEDACKWIKSKPITKVLMNPPFENKYGCMTIVENVLDSVQKGIKCGFILPDKKLEKASKSAIKRILSNHSIRKIVKLPENLFDAGVTASIFIFETGVPQGKDEIFACYIEDDGLETVKNQGRQDIRGKWSELEDYWVNVIRKQSGDSTVQWLKPSEHLSYQMPEKEFELYEEDFTKTVLDYLMFEEKIDVKEFNEKLLNKILYNSNVEETEEDIAIKVKKVGGSND